MLGLRRERLPRMTRAQIPETEDEFASKVEELLDLSGWEWYHTRRSDRSKKGFPDYVCIRNAGLRGSGARLSNELLVFELKGNAASGRGTVSEDQKKWLHLFAGVPGVKSGVFWPEDLDTLAKLIMDR